MGKGAARGDARRGKVAWGETDDDEGLRGEPALVAEAAGVGEQLSRRREWLRLTGAWRRMKRERIMWLRSDDKWVLCVKDLKRLLVYPMNIELSIFLQVFKNFKFS
jgi:hypothetical protein